jgi:hypothetical protein
MAKQPKHVEDGYKLALDFLEGWHDRLATHGPAILGEFIMELNHTRLKLIKVYYEENTDDPIPPRGE